MTCTQWHRWLRADSSAYNSYICLHSYSTLHGHLRGSSLGTTFAVDSGTYYATRVTSTLATGVETADADMTQGVVIAQNAHWGRGAGFDSYNDGLVGKESTATAAKSVETFNQTRGDETRHPKVEWRRHQAGRVARLGQVVTQTAVDKVGHALRRGSLTAVALLPACLFECLLQVHHAQRVGRIVDILVCLGKSAIGHGLGKEGGKLAVEVLRTCFDHHARIAPGGIARRGAHAVHHNLLRSAGCGHNYAARAHAETVHAATAALCHIAILSCGQILATAIGVVILYLVDECGGVFQAHTHGNAFLLECHTLRV